MAKRLAKTRKRLLNKATTEISLQHGRNVPPAYAYQELSNVELDIEPFKDESSEQNRSESELKTYFSSLYDHVQKRRYARPINRNDPNKLFKPLYDYSKTKTTDIDLRPSYYKFMENMEKTNPDLYKELNDPIPTEDLIDMNYLQLHENRHVPKIMPDEEYPDWVWELVPESRKYWWTDLVQTPFENLSQVEKFQLLRKWRKTLMVSNNQWNKSHLGKLGQVRGKYNDPWPSPITKMDIKLYQKDDRHYQSALKQTKEVNRSMKNKKRFETDSDYLENQSMYNMNNDQQLILESEQIDNINQDNHELELIEDETIDLAKYYGLDNIDTEIDVDNDNNKKYGIVYDVLLKEK